MGGTLAVLAVAAMVVVMTPRASSGPVALSATTTPITVRATVQPPATATVSAQVRTPVAALLTSFVAFPHAVTSEPELDLDGTAVADELPADGDLVLLRTEAVTYRLRWDEVQFVNAPDGSVVFDTAGDVVARVAGGEFVMLVGG